MIIPFDVEEEKFVEMTRVAETFEDVVNVCEKILEYIESKSEKEESKSFDVKDTLSIPLKEARENFEKEYLTTQLKKFGGNISKMAKFIGMERSALHRKLKTLGVKGLN